MTATTHSTTVERLLADAYDLEQAGRLAEATELRTLAKDAAALVDTADPLLAAARWLDAHTSSDRHEPFGALSDGTPIVATIDPVEPSGLVRTTFGAWRLFAQDDPDLFTIYGDGFNLGDLTRDQIGTMRALFTSDIPEQLLASAAAHGRGDVEPPVFAGSSCPVRVERWGDKEGSAYTDLIIGDGLTKVLIGTHGGDKIGVELVIGGNCINDKLDEVMTLADVRQLRDNLTALIEDTRAAALVHEPQVKVHSPLFQELKSWIDTKLAEDEPVEWHYSHGAAELTIEEDADTQITGGSLALGKHIISLFPADIPALRDLACLLHDHCAQNTLGMLDIGGRVGPLTLSHFDPSYTRKEFDNACIHEYETQLHDAMVRMGLSDVAMRDLFRHILSIASATSTQQRMDGYRDGIKAVVDLAEQSVAA